MNKNFFLSLIFLITFFSISAINVTFAYENREQPPFYLKNTEEIPEKPGVAVEIVKRLEKHIPDLNITFVRYPWKRCKLCLKAGKVDGIFNASFKKSRLKIGRYPMIDSLPDSTKKITDISYHIYVRSDSKVDFNGKTFANLKTPIGAPRGYSIVNDLRNKGFSVSETNNSEINLKKLLYKRIDAVALQDVTADNIIRKNEKFRKNIKKIEIPIATKPYYLMLSKQFVEKNPELSEEIWNTLKKIRNQKYKDILEKY